MSLPPATHKTRKAPALQEQRMPIAADELPSPSVEERTSSSKHLTLRHPRLPRWAPHLVAAVAAAAAGLLVLSLGWGPIAWILLAVIVFSVALPTWSLLVEGRRAAIDRLVSTLVWVAFGLALLPLVSLLSTVVSHGAPSGISA